jgi:hypothetical protein|tara:strand:+ start:490 stop:786 length:297 start_codon:yes stop_codon:yes gene_type:complete
MIHATTMAFEKKIHTNVVFDNGPRMVSLSLDNGAGGGLSSQSRADIRLLFSHPLEGGVKDVTEEVFPASHPGEPVRATIENMDRAMKWLRLVRWGMLA